MFFFPENEYRIFKITVRPSSRFIFSDDTKFPDDFATNFSKNNIKRDYLNKYLAQKFLIFHESPVILVVTFNDSILSSTMLQESMISPCTSEEADQRIIHHVINLANIGYQCIQIRTVDTDVLILSIAYSEIIFSKGVSMFHLIVVRENFTIFIQSSLNLVQTFAKLYRFFTPLLAVIPYPAFIIMVSVNFLILGWH